MGAWGTGFWNDDTTSDVRNSYLDGLKKKRPPQEILAQLVDEFEMNADDDGYLCWLAVALLQWEYGHLSEAVKGKALAVLHSDADEKRWMEASEKDQHKRREVMRQLETKLLSTNEKPKKARPYVRKQTKWKVGDVISLRFGTMKPHQAERLWSFQDLYGAVLVVDFWEKDLGDIYITPVVTPYEWIGCSPAQEKDLKNASFLSEQSCRGAVMARFWLGDVPLKQDYSWYDLNVLFHMDQIPFSKEELPSPQAAHTFGWGNLGAIIADTWLEMGWAVPSPQEPTSDTYQKS